MDPNYSLAPQVEVVGGARPGQFLKHVYSLYRQRFNEWFGITAPTSLLAAAILWMADHRIKAIFRSIPRGEFRHHFAEIAEAMIFRFGGFFLSWLLGCFALAAIATLVSELDGGDDAVWIHDRHQRAREHFGKLALAAFFTFCAFLAGIVAAGIVETAAIRLAGWSRFSRFNYGAALASYVLVASIISWFGMAIPLVLRGNTKVWASLKRSVELSNGYESALFWLVVQSVAGSYLAGYGTYYGVSLFFPSPLRDTLWYGWLVYVVAVLAGAAIEPPIFIGFSLLADPEQLNASALPRS